jgi:hypothetical protein
MVKTAISDAYITYDQELLSKDATYIIKSPNSDLIDVDINVRETADGYSKVMDKIKWGKEVKILDGVSYSAGFNRVKIIYLSPGFLNIGEIKKEGWVPLEFLVKK